MKISLQKNIKTSDKLVLLPFRKNLIKSKLILELSGIKGGYKFEGNFNEYTLLINPTNARLVFLVGLGEEKHSNRAVEVFRSLFTKEEKYFFGKCVSYLHADQEGLAFAIAQAGKMIDHSSRNWDKKFVGKETRKSKPLSMAFITDDVTDVNSVKKLAQEGVLTAESQMGIMDLIDRPANFKTPSFLADYVKKSGKQYGYKVKITKGKAIPKKGLHALDSVSKGSEEDAVFIEMEYSQSSRKSSKQSKQPQLGLVGKGITFDTGGVSIKGATNMHYMKCDMGGAAAVIGAIELAAKLNLDISVVGIVPCSENCVDGKGTKPGDVIQSYSGKSIEVIDTDAEGRLILADGLAYMEKNYAPDVMLDLATLTGSAVRSLGYSAAALFTENDLLAERLHKVGTEIHERLWRMPLYEEYGSEIKSDVADVKNLGNKPMAGAAIAAKFLEHFTNGHTKWAHLDIAGVAFGTTPSAKYKAGTGYGVRLLVEFMKSMQKEKI